MRRRTDTFGRRPACLLSEDRGHRRDGTEATRSPRKGRRRIATEAVPPRAADAVMGAHRRARRRHAQAKGSRQAARAARRRGHRRAARWCSTPAGGCAPTILALTGSASRIAVPRPGGLIATGDEIVAPEKGRGRPGAQRQPVLAGGDGSCGGAPPTDYGVVPDRPERRTSVPATALARNDVVMLSGAAGRRERPDHRRDHRLPHRKSSPRNWLRRASRRFWRARWASR